MDGMEYRHNKMEKFNRKHLKATMMRKNIKQCMMSYLFPTIHCLILSI